MLITCGLQKTRDAQTIASRMAFTRFARVRGTRSLQMCFFNPRTQNANCSNLGKRQIIKIAESLFVEISAFFYSKVQVAGLCKKVLLKLQKKELWQMGIRDSSIKTIYSNMRGWSCLPFRAYSMVSGKSSRCATIELGLLL